MCDCGQSNRVDCVNRRMPALSKTFTFNFKNVTQHLLQAYSFPSLEHGGGSQLIWESFHLK